MIITDIEKLQNPSSPLEFIDTSGTHLEEGQKIINQLKAELEINKEILALSAPQIGINKRIFCIRFDTDIKVFINPIITKKAKYSIGVETCASMPKKEILNLRPDEITLVYYNNDFKYEDNKLCGYAAKLADQQIQLLDGITPDLCGLVSDIEKDGQLADLTEEEYKEVIELYKEFIKIKNDAYKNFINANPESKKAYNYLKFTEDVVNGETLVIENPDEKAPKNLNRSQRRALDKHAKQYKAKLNQKNNKKGKK